MTTKNVKKTNFNAINLASFVSVGFIVYKLYKKISSLDTNDKSEELQESKSDIRSHWGYEVHDNEKKTSKMDLKALVHSTDHFNGIRINANELPQNQNVFKLKLKYSLNKWKNTGKRGIFLKLPIKYHNYLSIALSEGFEIHHARAEYIMLTKWLPIQQINMIPDYCHTYLSVGCLIINKNKKGVVIQEIWNHGRNDHWKLPGGAIDRLEHIYIAAERETKEETGLTCNFIGILQFRHFYPFRFSNTGDIYFICLLKYDGYDDKFTNFDKNEIDNIKWMDIDDILKIKCQQFTFGDDKSKNNIKKNVDILMKNWDKNNKIDLMTTFHYHSPRPNREWFVYGNQVDKITL